MRRLWDWIREQRRALRSWRRGPIYDWYEADPFLRQPSHVRHVTSWPPR